LRTASVTAPALSIMSDSARDTARDFPRDSTREDRRKAPRRTAERILATALDLFNRRGEPNVSTTLISAELNISPGNLYYHYPAKEELVNALMSRYEKALHQLLGDSISAAIDDSCAWTDTSPDTQPGRLNNTPGEASPAAPGSPSALRAPAAELVYNPSPDWQLLPALLQLAWRYRFLFRDLNDLLARNRQLEMRCQDALARQQAAVRDRVERLCRTPDGAPALDATATDALATSIVLLLTYWLSFEYVRDPRRALEPDSEAAVLDRGTRHVMALIAPYL
jgi:AcrR family transcriptional regulator